MIMKELKLSISWNWTFLIYFCWYRRVVCKSRTKAISCKKEIRRKWTFIYCYYKRKSSFYKNW